MSILFVFILNLIYVSYVRSDGLPSVICAYGGNTVFTKVKKNLNFNVADVPERCEAVLYGEHYMNGPPDNKDAPALQSLVSAGKNVYMLYKTPESADWATIVQDPAQVDKFIAPMISYLNENKIKGVILGYLGLFAGIVPDYATHMNYVITRIKQCVPSIKVGLYVQGGNAPQFGDAKLFDFSKVDPNVDFYDIDLWSAGDSCHENIIATGGRYPKTSADKTIVAMDQILTAAPKSGMKEAKLMVGIIDLVQTVDAKKTNYDTITYSEFCKGGDHKNIIWCGDNSKILYDEVINLKTVFKGIIINYLDLDDTDNSCGCGKYPVANTFIDAMKGIAMTNCPKIC